MNIVSIIGARGGSKRIPNKNLARIGTIPLIGYSIMTARNLGYPVYVSTDSPEIAETSKGWGAEVIDRPPDFATDLATDYGWIFHLLLELEARGEHTPDLLLFLRPTTPIRATFKIKEALDSLDSSSSSLRSVEPITEALEKHFRIKGDYLESPFPMELDATNLPNQVFPKAYRANGYVDILRPHQVKTSLTGDIYGTNIQAFITPKTIEIDTLEDLDYAHYYLSKHVT